MHRLGLPFCAGAENNNVPHPKTARVFSPDFVPVSVDIFYAYKNPSTVCVDVNAKKNEYCPSSILIISLHRPATPPDGVMNYPATSFLPDKNTYRLSYN